ncbi:MAG: ATP-binding protein [Candidatus Nanoarchaeia archaeon]|nr:ATP-binding protein [Candidatus Nanoarchaeia archaeon]MDD5740419.1 ATP-binding protein [Candidatus Nanoarchaeia archaeon]
MKVVITGGPCSGKTTLINELKKRGYYCLDEVAREILTENKNISFLELQEEVFKKQIQKENNINGELVFLDRGLVDNYVYYSQSNNFPDYIKNFEYKGRYDKILFLERFQFENDGLRIEKDEKEAGEIHDKIRHTYSNFGYNLLEVPRMDVGKRADFILFHIKDLKGGGN